MAKKSWLKTLEEVLSGYSGAPREKVTPNSRKIGSNTYDPSEWSGQFREPNRTFDTRTLDEGEAATALRNDPDGWGSNRYNLSSNPYARDQIGVNKESQRSVNMKVSDPRAWTMNQVIGSSYGSFPKKSKNMFVEGLQEINSAVNRNINRGTMAMLNALDGKLIPKEKARRAKQAVRNTARMDEQLLIGSRGMPRSEQAYKELYNYNKARAAEARDVAGFTPKSSIQGEPSRTLRDYVDEEASFRDAYANTYKPSNTYRVIRGAAKLSPFLLGGAYEGGAFGKRAKSSKKTSEPICDCGKPESQCTCAGHKHNAKTKKSMLKSISSINQNGTRHVLGGYRGSKLNKGVVDNLKNSGKKIVENIKNSDPVRLARFLSNMSPSSLKFYISSPYSKDMTEWGGGATRIARESHANGMIPEIMLNAGDSNIRYSEIGKPTYNAHLKSNSGKTHGSPMRKSINKSMNMRTQSPKMPSTKRDVRHTDKYFR